MSDDETKAAIDAMIYGTGILRDGKHVSVDDFYPEPPEERPNAQDYRNRGERDAAYWRELCEILVSDEVTDAQYADTFHKARAELARINAEALR